eukprot:scaffold1968_cov89-Skeletonema_dohrnii-CCMP3373.AAC.6
MIHSSRSRWTRGRAKMRKPLSSPAPDLSLLSLYLYYLILSLRLAHLPRMICHLHRKKMRPTMTIFLRRRCYPLLVRSLR